MNNICIVGYGAIGPVHARAVEGLQSARLYGVCDIEASKRKICLEEYQQKGIFLQEYAEFDQVLQDENITSVHICTPHYLHFDMVKKALAAGKDVVVEKPVTRTREEFESLLALEGAEKVCVVFQNRLNPGIVKLKEIIEKKELGEIKAVRAVLTWHRDQAYYESADWRGKWATEGGGLLINQAVHTLDFFQYLVGAIESVNANMYNYSLKDVIEVEDTLTAVLHFKSGIRGIFFATNAYEKNESPFFEIHFERGTVRYIDNQLWYNGKILAEDAVPEKGKVYWGKGHAGLLRQFYEEHKYFSVYDVQNTMETLFAIYESADCGGALKYVNR